jgi:peptide-methionine (S)-S-oxide reductase
MSRATFAAGCFWGVETAFRAVPGVTGTLVGYTGGSTEDPTYRQVCSGRTGHAEAVQVDFDPEKITYTDLLDTFWRIHDPTTLNRQGPDVGTQYRSAVFFHDAGQEMEARRSLEAEQASRSRPIVTEVVGAGPFWPAEEYHQRYFEKTGRAGCHLPG